MSIRVLFLAILTISLVMPISTNKQKKKRLIVLSSRSVRQKGAMLLPTNRDGIPYRIAEHGYYRVAPGATAIVRVLKPEGVQSRGMWAFAPQKDSNCRLEMRCPCFFVPRDRIVSDNCDGSSLNVVGRLQKTITKVRTKTVSNNKGKVLSVSKATSRREQLLENQQQFCNVAQPPGVLSTSRNLFLRLRTSRAAYVKCSVFCRPEGDTESSPPPLRCGLYSASGGDPYPDYNYDISTMLPDYYCCSCKKNCEYEPEYGPYY